MILLDLDGFKKYNDAHGHLAGDEMLRSVGQIINTCIRGDVDSGYRYGGDEFAVILIDADVSIAEEIGKRVQQNFNKNKDITISLGYTVFTEGMTVKDLVADADKNLYEAKIRGRAS